MANSELKAALRTFCREKSYALINLAGLSLAIGCCLILGLYLKSELTYDRHNTRYREIFRIVGEYTTSGNTVRCAVTPIPLGPMLKENYSEVKDYVRFSGIGKILVRSGDRAFYWEDIYAADANVFDVFTHKILYGDPKTALKDPSGAAVSESFARKYFGDINPVGKTIHADSTPDIPRKITLVFRDLPENTHLKYSALFHLEDLPSQVNRRNLLYNIGLYTYLVMPENYPVLNFNAISQAFFSTYMEEMGKAIGQTWKSRLQPLPDIHLHSDVSYDRPTGNRYYVYGFAVVAIFILLVACINYVNLAIARAAKRTKEIGMRKILGVPQYRLILRFIGEALFFSMIATAVSVGLVELALRLTPITELLGKPLALGLRNEPTLFLWLAGLGLVVGLLSGFYPAFYLSSVAPISALAATRGAGKGGGRIRELLVLIQFTVSVVVIACTIIMALQMRYVSGKALGFEKQNRVTINLRGLDVIEKYPVIKNELLRDSRIMGVSVSGNVIGTEVYSIIHSTVDNESGEPGKIILGNMQVGDDFIEVMGIQLVAGRSFAKKLLTDVGTTFVVNETLVKNRGWKNPLGKRIQMAGAGKVIGVVRDFHAKSLHSAVEPFVMYRFNDNFENIPAEARGAFQRVMTVKLSGKDVQQTLKFLQDKFAVYDPKHPFEYAFLDDTIDKLYLSEGRLMRMTGVFSGICIFISCLGLFGLSAFTTEQRNKEIGIRKVLGASAMQIIVMLARKTLWLVVAASVAATIIAYYAMEEWLSGFAYRVGTRPVAFVASAILVIAVAFFTVVLQSWKAAQTNPAEMIRYE